MDPKHPDTGRRSINSVDRGERGDVESVSGDRGSVEDVDSNAPSPGIEQTRTGDSAPPDSLDTDDRSGVEGI